ncbi:MAG TPA: DUF4383 domain-containing protein [Chloroflexota bacterium]
MSLHVAPSWSTRIDALALIGVAVGIWIQALAGAPEYAAIPPGPIVLVILAVCILVVTRWRWMPMTGTLLSALILAGAFATPYTANRLSDPAAAGIFVGTVIQMLALVIGLFAGIFATAEGYRGRTAAIVCRMLGAIFVAIGVVAVFRGSPENLYHNLLHIATGIIALYVGIARPGAGARAFAVAFGVFYLALGTLGIVIGDAAMNRLWEIGPLHLTIGDHGFHLILGTILLTSGLLTRDLAPEQPQDSRAATLAPSPR